MPKKTDETGKDEIKKDWWKFHNEDIHNVLHPWHC